MKRSLIQQVGESALIEAALPRGKLEHISAILPHVWGLILPHDAPPANAAADETEVPLPALVLDPPPGMELIDV
ncbi:MAG: hypothetical protein HYS13_08600 [Planctomycetia bacterium]|nr:hypothetical protein [Planctomycetia bacterium]